MIEIVRLAIEYLYDPRPSPILNKSILGTAAARKVAQQFFTHLDSKLRILPLDIRVPYILREVGYTNNAQTRRDQHHKYHSTNYLMQLFEEIARYLFAEVKYRNRFEVIFLCYRYDQPPRAEIIFSILCQAYTTTGRGFSHASAGISVVSRNKYTTKQWQEWLSEMWMQPTQLYQKNLAQEKIRYDEWELEMADLRKQLKDTEEESKQLVVDIIHATERETEILIAHNEAMKRVEALQLQLLREEGIITDAGLDDSDDTMHHSDETTSSEDAGSRGEENQRTERDDGDSAMFNSDW